MSEKGQFLVVVQSETEPGKTRRWGAFVCPDCRFVFRVPRDHDGEGIVCPSCRRILRIPKEGEETAPLMAPLQRVHFSEDNQEPKGEKRTRSKRKRKKQKAEVPAWDPASGKWRTDSAGRKRRLKTFAAWVAFLTALMPAIYLFQKAGERDRTRPEKAIQANTVPPDNPVSVPLVLPEENGSEQADPPADAE